MPLPQPRTRSARPVLFLDIDGVLNTARMFETAEEEAHQLSPARIALLNGVLAATGCRVVVSSTWRESLPVRRLLRAHGFVGTFARDWRTPLFGFDAPDQRRGAEIADWLSRHGHPPYAIVDDEADMLPEQLPRLVQTTFAQGLTRAHAKRLIALLKPA